MSSSCAGALTRIQAAENAGDFVTFEREVRRAQALAEARKDKKRRTYQVGRCMHACWLLLQSTADDETER
jgi:hypothetical protein